MLSDKNKLNLAAMSLVERVSTTLGTISWIWGGFTVDIYKGRILREHDDLDYLTLNLRQLRLQFVEFFENMGWQAENLVTGDLRLRKDGVKVRLGHVEWSEKATWAHNGEKGHIYFPIQWLRQELTQFYDVELHVIEPEFQYVLKERPEMLNPEWVLREQDIVAKQQLKKTLESRGVDVSDLGSQVSDWVMTN